MSDMQIVKVVVRGELPKKCVECGYGYSTGRNGACRAMSFTGESPQRVDEMIYWDGRPLWCPLVLEDEEEKE